MSTTTKSLSRREFLTLALTSLAALAFPGFSAGGVKAGNFRAVYLDPEERDRFYWFLLEVFRLYPEDRFHQLIIDLSREKSGDKEIYEELQRRLPSIKAPLNAFKYALPALRKQKEEMARQTLALLGQNTAVDGYLEIGSPARYLSALRKRLDLRGPVWVLNDSEPSYRPEDMLERGRLAKLGAYVPMGDYDPFAGTRIPDGSLDLVVNLIGLHHCPAPKLTGFVSSIKRVLRPGGRLILRDHDAGTPKRRVFVALAHDVFNAGVQLPWDENARQVRLFRSYADWTDYFAAAGFKRTEKILAQDHDPTDNLLSCFLRV
jgi:SAM-dependent methyltransferase